jgi:hypothetical protein
LQIGPRIAKNCQNLKQCSGRPLKSCDGSCYRFLKLKSSSYLAPGEREIAMRMVLCYIFCTRIHGPFWREKIRGFLGKTRIYPPTRDFVNTLNPAGICTHCTLLLGWIQNIFANFAVSQNFFKIFQNLAEILYSKIRMQLTEKKKF